MALATTQLLKVQAAWEGKNGLVGKRLREHI